VKRRSAILLVLVGVVATIGVIILVTYSCQTGWFSAAVYRYTGSGKWLYSALYHGVQNGDTVKEVERLLGPGKEADSRVRNAVKKLTQRYPNLDGYEESDVVLGFRLPSGELYLQFRDGVLINFDPEDFRKYEEPQIVGQ
jgi:hypothetical protein